MTKQLSIGDVIRQFNSVINDPNAPQPSPKKMLLNASQMAVVRQMMDAGALSNHPPSNREIYEKEMPDEVPQVQPHDHGK